MKRYLGYQFKQAVEELTLKIAEEFKVKVQSIEWIAGLSTAGTDNYGDIYFSDVSDDAVLFDIDVQRYVGFAVHEMLHRAYTDFNVTTENHYLRQLHNACEDAWIEHKGIDNNLTGNIRGLLTCLLDQIVTEANATVNDWTDPRQYPFIFAVYLRRHLNNHVPVPEGIEWIINKASSDILNCKSSNDTLALAEWIMAQLKGLPPNPPKGATKPSKKPQDAQSEGGQGEGSRLDQNPFEGVGPARSPIDAERDENARSVEPVNQVPKGKRGIGSWCEGASVVDSNRHTRANPWLKSAHRVPARLRYEVKRLFDNSGTEEFQRNRRAGSLNVSALHKYGVTDKLFQRRHETDGIDSAVAVVLDISGSMFDDGERDEEHGCSSRIVQAVLTAQALIETLQKSQVATCVLAFGSQVSVIKPFGEHPKKSEMKMKSLHDGGGTNDYFAIRYAHKLLLGRHERRKIAFVITDGQGRPDYVRQQCESGKNLGVTTIGIGIQSDVRKVYPNAINVSTVDDLGAVSFKQIKLAV